MTLFPRKWREKDYEPMAYGIHKNEKIKTDVKKKWRKLETDKPTEEFKIESEYRKSVRNGPKDPEVMTTLWKWRRECFSKIMLKQKERRNWLIEHGEFKTRN